MKQQLNIQAHVAQDATPTTIQRWCIKCARELRKHVARKGLNRLSFDRVPMPPQGPMEFLVQTYTTDGIRLLATFVLPMNPEYPPYYAVRADVLVDGIAGGAPEPEQD